jgi:hypothetical protein
MPAWATPASATKLDDLRTRRPLDPTAVAGIWEHIAVAGAVCSVTVAAGTTVTFSHHSAEYFEVTVALPLTQPRAG